MRQEVWNELNHSKNDPEYRAGFIAGLRRLFEIARAEEENTVRVALKTSIREE